MDYAATQFEIKALNDSGQIEGLAAAFGNVDHGGEKMLFGSVTKTLAARGDRPLPMLFCHDLKRPIGAWKSWEERPEGMFVKGAITLATRDGQEAHALARDGALSGLSVGYKVRGDKHTREARELHDVELFEASLVPVPMNDRTRVTAIKSITGPADIEELFRERGFSGRKAKAGASAAWKSISDYQPEALDEIARLFEQHSAKLADLGVN